MSDGRCREADGRGCVSDGRRREADGRGCVSDGRCREADGRGCVSDGRCREADGRGCVSDGKCREVDGRGCVSDGKCREADRRGCVSDGRCREADGRGYVSDGRCREASHAGTRRSAPRIGQGLADATAPVATPPAVRVGHRSRARSHRPTFRRVLRLPVTTIASANNPIATMLPFAPNPAPQSRIIHTRLSREAARYHRPCPACSFPNPHPHRRRHSSGPVAASLRGR